MNSLETIRNISRISPVVGKIPAEAIRAILRNTPGFCAAISDAAQAAADWVENLRRSLALPDRLRDVNAPQEGLELIALATLHGRALATNPRPVTDAGPIVTVLREAW